MIMRCGDGSVSVKHALQVTYASVMFMNSLNDDPWGTCRANLAL